MVVEAGVLMKMKTHTFRFGRYRVTVGAPYAGYCEVPSKSKILDMWIEEGNTLSALDTAIHEAMHAEGISDSYVHDGSPDRIARFLWRLGWRKKK